MAGKATVWPLVSDHLRTLRADESEHISVRDVVTHFVLPSVIALAVCLLGVRLDDAGQVIAGASILAGFSFGFAIWVFELRIEAARDPRITKGSYLLELLDELFDNVSYLILVGLVVVACTIAATGFTTSEASTDGVLNAWWTGLLVALSLHYLVTLLMCLKRIRKAYQELTI